MLYHIFLLHKMPEEYCRIKDYLQLSGCEVTEGGFDQISRYEKVIEDADLVLISCDD